MHPTAVLNTAIVTADGTYRLTTVTLEEARALVRGPIDSAVGHDSTAELLTELLGVPVATNRQTFAHQVGQKAVVLKLHGRAPEGRVLSRGELERAGYALKVLERIA